MSKFLMINSAMTVVPLFLSMTAVNTWFSFKTAVSIDEKVLNRDRAAIILEHYLDTGNCLSVKNANKKERLIGPRHTKIAFGKKSVLKVVSTDPKAFDERVNDKFLISEDGLHVNICNDPSTED